jgi:predicted lipoprotein
LAITLLGALALCACSSSDDSSNSQPAGFDDSAVITDMADQVVVPTYQLLVTRADALRDAVDALAAHTDADHLTAAKDAWVATRAPWEQSEAFLFGPVEANGYDPAMDSWPVNETDLLNVLNSSDTIDAGYVANLNETQKGFHTIEYLLYGADSQKTAGQFTQRQFEYLSAITTEFVGITHALLDSWTTDAGTPPGPFRDTFATAGATGNTTYATLARAAEEMIDGMVAICDEVANGKIAEPLDNGRDPDLVESQFSFNSILDFQDNIRSVQNVYLGGSPLANTSGHGMTVWVASKDADLDARVKSQITAAIDAIGAIPSPFRDAIQDPANDDVIHAAQAAIRTLHDTLDTEVRNLVTQ